MAICGVYEETVWSKKFMTAAAESKDGRERCFILMSHLESIKNKSEKELAAKTSQAIKHLK